MSLAVSGSVTLGSAASRTKEAGLTTNFSACRGNPSPPDEEEELEDEELEEPPEVLLLAALEHESPPVTPIDKWKQPVCPSLTPDGLRRAA